LDRANSYGGTLFRAETLGSHQLKSFDENLDRLLEHSAYQDVSDEALKAITADLENTVASTAAIDEFGMPLVAPLGGMAVAGVAAAATAAATATTVSATAELEAPGDVEALLVTGLPGHQEQQMQGLEPLLDQSQPQHESEVTLQQPQQPEHQMDASEQRQAEPGSDTQASVRSTEPNTATAAAAAVEGVCAAPIPVPVSTAGETFSAAAGDTVTAPPTGSTATLQAHTAPAPATTTATAAQAQAPAQAPALVPVPLEALPEAALSGAKSAAV
jgi:hypothetical protein